MQQRESQLFYATEFFRAFDNARKIPAPGLSLVFK